MTEQSLVQGIRVWLSAALDTAQQLCTSRASLVCQGEEAPQPESTASEARQPAQQSTQGVSAAEAAPRPQDTSPQPKASSSRPNPVNPTNWLFDPKWGVPIVRRKVGYGELLRDIRQGRVKEISYFDENDTDAVGTKNYNVGLDGYCLVIYQDGRVAQVKCPARLMHTICPCMLGRQHDLHADWNCCMAIENTTFSIQVSWRSHRAADTAVVQRCIDQAAGAERATGVV